MHIETTIKSAYIRAVGVADYANAIGPHQAQSRLLFCEVQKIKSKAHMYGHCVSDNK